ncbi:hypothetical protein IT568_00655, partial [bacterium]|nr:hypothetical protein [bacterium]
MKNKIKKMLQTFGALVLLVTSLNAQTVFWSETFADTTLPAGWQIINNDGGGTAGQETWRYVPQITFTGGGTILPHAGTRFLFSSFNGANGFLI